jgi:hypothetical protein
MIDHMVYMTIVDREHYSWPNIYSKLCENSIRLPCTYAPYAKNIYFWVLKILNEKFHMYIFIIHMRS